MEHLVPSLETCKKLKEAGFPQHNNGEPSTVASYRDWDGEIDLIASGTHYGDYFSAPSAQELADELIEKKYQLRVEFNHGDMLWYAYYARKGGEVRLEIDGSGADTMAEALANLYLKEVA